MQDYTLGISSHFHDAAAALVQGDRIVAAAQEERFTRQKADWRFPDHAIRYCLSQLPDGVEPAAIAYYEDPGLKTRRILDTARAMAPRGARLWPQMLATLETLSTELPRQLLDVAKGNGDRLVFVPHHRSHAAAAFYPSPFEDAAVLVLDGVGEWSTTTMWSGNAGGLTALGEIRFPHSLGLFYSAFTQYCGFKVNSGEYKLMGLAPFGTPQFRKTILNNLIELRDDCSFALNMAYFDFDKGLSTTSPLFEMLFGQPARRPDAPITPFHMNIAASAQAVLEDVVLGLARTTLHRTGQRNLCLAGGVALNCVANSRIRLEVPGLDGLWIQPAAGDAGGALGAALEVAQQAPASRPRQRSRDAMSASLLGPEYSDAQIRAALDQADLTYEEISDPDTLAQSVAAALADSQVVGHFFGRMEFGPRALGNRSILADPRGTDTLNKVNRRIKFREDWRPFAPIVLADRAPDYFEAPDNSPYMLFVSKLKPAFRGPVTLGKARARGMHAPIKLQRAVTSDVAAVSHVDFSARLQTIDPADDARTGSRAGAILRAFDALTGCPMLLNTSFNVRGEPIVCDPKDAIDCFLNTHLDLLAIGPFLVWKKVQPDWVKEQIGRKKFAAD
ncbi:nodulation protein [Rhodobacter sp. NTK016B]|uniref:carbamoyltransferase family protein n=1 Tax=Rhodobacter sp. NTK016B TaxID=2759676 RepID=UPI001A8FC084|nr:carbamoyltransferase N-terminal domain-containing protein [Rhodobacter sp. NTK016B]MBN8290537.1 nodulation protein [Rhodobacter sp. NTK016B]